MNVLIGDASIYINRQDAKGRTEPRFCSEMHMLGKDHCMLFFMFIQMYNHQILLAFVVLEISQFVVKITHYNVKTHSDMVY